MIDFIEQILLDQSLKISLGTAYRICFFFCVFHSMLTSSLFCYKLNYRYCRILSVQVRSLIPVNSLFRQFLCHKMDMLPNRAVTDRHNHYTVPAGA